MANTTPLPPFDAPFQSCGVVEAVRTPLDFAGVGVRGEVAARVGVREDAARVGVREDVARVGVREVAGARVRARFAG